MTFLNSFEAVRYRGIDGLSFSHLANANLITGENGVGKTAALEAMWLFTGRYNTGLLWNQHVQRTDKPVLDPVARLAKDALELRGKERGSSHSLKAVFRKLADMERTREIPVESALGNSFMTPPVIARIYADLDGDPALRETAGVQVTPWGSVIFDKPQMPTERPDSIIFGTRFQVHTLDGYLQRYSDMVRANLKNNFTEAINLILPKIRDVEILTDEMGGSYLSALTDAGVQLPLHDLGGGVERLYQLYLSFFGARGGALYADEVENGLHHSVLENVWSHSRRWMRQWNVQLVATTHSDECIRAAMAAFEDAPDDLAIHKLYRNAETGKVEATTFTGEALEGARDLNLETR